MIEAEARFPDRLRELRRQAGLSQRELGGAIGEVDGGPVTGSAVGEWERGLSRPDRKKAFALDLLLGQPEGTFANMLGLRTLDLDYEARLTQLEDRFDRVEAALARLERARRR